MGGDFLPEIKPGDRSLVVEWLLLLKTYWRKYLNNEIATSPTTNFVLFDLLQWHILTSFFLCRFCLVYGLCWQPRQTDNVKENSLYLSGRAQSGPWRAPGCWRDSPYRKKKKEKEKKQWPLPRRGQQAAVELAGSRIGASASSTALGVVLSASSLGWCLHQMEVMIDDDNDGGDSNKNSSCLPTANNHRNAGCPKALFIMAVASVAVDGRVPLFVPKMLLPCVQNTATAFSTCRSQPKPGSSPAVRDPF